jgi:SAM-dependent methyltransferase
MEDLVRMSTSATCRFCGAALTESFCDLGLSPLANSYVRADQLDQGERFYPLHAYVCSECYLVQLAEFETPEQIFGDYAYFSSFSRSWLEHARAYVEQTSARFDLGPSNQIVEIASNDGYLLQYFVERELPVLGIEPAANVAAAAQERGIPTLVEFFGTELATRLRDEGTTADLLLGNNVLAHVPDLNDFVGGMATLLSDDGVITMEFPHLLQLMRHNQFDTIYHEHFSYFSFLTVSAVFAHHGVRLFDVEEIPTHGGSLRIYGCHAENAAHVTTERAQQLLAVERDAGLDRLRGYAAFPEQVRRTKRTLVRFLLDAKESGATIAAYGAPAKGNTLLNYAGVGTDVIDFTVDRSPHKQGFALPGTRIPIFAPERVFEAKPDYLLVLPWNLRDEIIEDMRGIRDWGGRFVFPIPAVTVVD